MTTTTRLATSHDALTNVDVVTRGATTLVDKHTLMTRDKAAAAAALKELDVLLTLQPLAARGHVVALESFRLDKATQRLHIVMEHCARGDLFTVAQDESRLVHAQLLAPHHGLTTSERGVRRIAFQTLAGLQTLHHLNLAHMDVSLENVFLTARGDVRVGDFALAQRFERDAHGRVQRLAHAPHVAKPAYAAPELFVPGRPIHDVTKADAWSLGVLLYHLLTRSPLFPTGAPTLQDPVFRAIAQSPQWIDTLLPTASSACRDLLVRLLDPNASSRLSVDAAMEHAWFTRRKTQPKTLETKAASTPIRSRSRDRTASAEISLDVTRVAIRPSRLRCP